MDTQDMALLVIAGILLVALVVVNTAVPASAETAEQITGEVKAPAIPQGAPKMGVTSYVFVYDPSETLSSVVEVI